MQMYDSSFERRGSDNRKWEEASVGRLHLEDVTICNILFMYLHQGLDCGVAMISLIDKAAPGIIIT